MRLLPTIALLSFVSATACNNQHEETVAEYAKNPQGCRPESADWYSTQSQSKAGIDVLQTRYRTFKMRGDYHGQQVEFISSNRETRNENIRKAITCLREAQWASETLVKVGVAPVAAKKP